jgi:tripartite-type tricarboxylate transporter receptor subunit TctC
MQKLSERLSATFLVENRSGAGGTIGTEIVAKAANDGYTLGMVSGSHAINPGIYHKLAYDAVYDFSPITLLAYGPSLLVVHPSVAAISDHVSSGNGQVRPLAPPQSARMEQLTRRIHPAAMGNR